MISLLSAVYSYVFSCTVNFIVINENGVNLTVWGGTYS